MNKWESLGNGVVVPSLTFFHPDFSLDVHNQKMCYDHIIANKADCIFLLSSTGEGSFIHQNLALEEFLLEFSSKVLPSKIFLAVGCFGESTKEIIKDMNSKMKYSRIDAFVITPPRNTHINSEDCAKMLIEVANYAEKPVFLYNNPENFNGNEIPIDFLPVFAQHENIIGIKDSSSSFMYKKKCITFLSEKFWFLTGKEGDLGSLILETPRKKREFIGVVPSLGNLVNIYYQILQNRENDEKVKILQAEVNSWRDNFYDLSMRKGKAQRGLKISLEILYYQNVQFQPIVSPELRSSPSSNFIENVRVWLPKLIKRGFITVVGDK